MSPETFVAVDLTVEERGGGMRVEVGRSADGAEALLALQAGDDLCKRMTVGGVEVCVPGPVASDNESFPVGEVVGPDRFAPAEDVIY